MLCDLKRIIAILFSLVLCFSLCSCKSAEERELERAIDAADRAEENYQRAVDSYNETKRDIEEYERLLDALK